MDAIVLAGAPVERNMTAKDGYVSRGMVEIEHKTMLQWVVEALRGSGRIERIVVVGDAQADGVDRVICPAPGFLENIMLGLEQVNEGGRVLVVSSDIPLVTSEAISDFIDRSIETGADFCYPIIPKAACTGRYPGMSRTYLKTAQGTFTGGNLVLVSHEFMKRNEEVIGQAYGARKRVLALSRMIGLGVLVRALAAQLLFPRLLSIPHLERTVGRILGGSVSVIVTEFPEIGEDVDKLSDLEEVRRILATSPGDERLVADGERAGG